MITVLNQASGDNYTDANTFEQRQSVRCSYIIANAAVLWEYYLPTGDGTTYQWSGEAFKVPTTGDDFFPDVGGVRFRSAKAGTPALVSLVIYTADESPQGSSAPFTQTVTASGGIINPVLPGTLNFQHNGLAVAAEAGLDFDDQSTAGEIPFVWSVLDDAANSRVRVTPTISGIPYQHNDVAVATRQALDFEDSAAGVSGTPALTWTMADDGAGKRVKVTPVLTLSGVETLLADSGVLGGATASIDFSSIPATFGTLRVLFACRGTNASQTTRLLMRINNDSGANYDDELWSMTAAAVTIQHNAGGQTACSLGVLAANTATASKMGSGEIIIPGYAGTTFHKAPSSTGQYSGDGAQNTVQGMTTWSSTAAINRLTFLCAAGNFATGSRIMLYGL